MKISNKEKIEKAIELVQEAKVTPYKISKDTGITEATIGNYKNGKTKPTFANAKVILDYFDSYKSTATPQKSYTAGVPYYNVDFVGGFDLVVNDQTTHPDYLIDFKEYNKADCWCNITGRSMEPEINSGDIVALKEVKDWKMFLPLGEIYAIVAKNGMRTVKKLGGGVDKDSYTLIPTNKSNEYGEQPLQKSAIDKIYLVLGCMKKF